MLPDYYYWMGDGHIFHSMSWHLHVAESLSKMFHCLKLILYWFCKIPNLNLTFLHYLLTLHVIPNLHVYLNGEGTFLKNSRIQTNLFQTMAAHFDHSCQSPKNTKEHKDLRTIFRVIILHSQTTYVGTDNVNPDMTSAILMPSKIKFYIIGRGDCSIWSYVTSKIFIVHKFHGLLLCVFMVFLVLFEACMIELLLYGKELHEDSSKCFLLCSTEKVTWA